jgi:hypothetical protein
MPPDWFDAQMDLFASAVQKAAIGELKVARQLIGTIRSDHLRAWFVEHGQNTFGFRIRLLGRPTPTLATELDNVRNPTVSMQREVFARDGYRCRYCGIRLVDRSVLAALADVVGREVFCPTGTNAQRHGVIMAFRVCADHVVPWKGGGRTAVDNLVSACPSCNYGKSNYTLDQLGLDDPRGRPPSPSDGWDGLLPFVSALRKQARNAKRTENTMTRVEVIGNVDEQHRLNIVVPDQVKSGPVKVILEIGDDGEDDWRMGVAHVWARDWSDPREDLYTLEDGEPIHDAR